MELVGRLYALLYPVAEGGNSCVDIGRNEETADDQAIGHDSDLLQSVVIANQRATRVTL